MDIALDTFLVTLYVIVDDLYRAHFAPHKPQRPGPKPYLSDSEVLTLVLCSQWFGNSQRWMIAYAARHWRCYFPRLLSQSQTNRRARDLVGVLMQFVPLVAEQMEAELAAYEALDGVPVPLMRCCRGLRHRVFADEADIGKGGADRRYYFGCQLLLSVTPTGIITGFLLGPASTNIRWLADSFLCWRQDPHASPVQPDDLPCLHNRGRIDYVGPRGRIWPRTGVGRAIPEPYIADLGFAGVTWSQHWLADYQALLITPASYVGPGAESAKVQHRCWRHVIETVNSHLETVFHLFYPLARCIWGLLTRVAAKMAAFNLSIWLNRMFGRPDFAVATLFQP